LSLTIYERGRGSATGLPELAPSKREPPSHRVRHQVLPMGSKTGTGTRQDWSWWCACTPLRCPSTNDGRGRGSATWFFGRQLLANIHGDGRFEFAVLWCRWFFKPRYPRLAAARKGLWTVI